MNEKWKVIVGLVIVLIIGTFPIWYSLAIGESGERPELEYPDPEEHLNCIEDKEFMISNHMDILDDWRDSVVRDGVTTYESEAFDETFEMSLTDTCLGCHDSRETFCNRCHDYADVDPYCWDCHLEPEEFAHE